MFITPTNLPAAVNGITQDPEQRRRILDAAQESLFGPYMATMIEHGIQRLGQGRTRPDTLAHALDVMAHLYQQASDDYGPYAAKLTADELQSHQQNVLQGRIVPLPRQAWSMVDKGRRQAQRANAELSGLPADVRMEIAALNYGAVFTNDTMANAALTLARSDLDQLAETADVAAMPHLTVSNWGVGQSVATVVQSAARLGKKVRIIDIGSGPGGTLAATIGSIAQAVPADRMPEISITALEATPKFHDQLNAFARSDVGAQRLDLTVDNTTAEDRNICKPGRFTTVYGDAVEALSNAAIDDDPDTITVVTANYSLHRMPMDAKQKLFEAVRRLSHVALVIGDLWDDTSEINRKYFNLAVNGPLNPGNVDLEQMLESLGFETVETGRRVPRGVNGAIAPRLDQPADDGHFTIAASDGLAMSALDLMTISRDLDVGRLHGTPGPSNG